MLLSRKICSRATEIVLFADIIQALHHRLCKMRLRRAFVAANIGVAAMAAPEQLKLHLPPTDAASAAAGAFHAAAKASAEAAAAAPSVATAAARGYHPASLLAAHEISRPSAQQPQLLRRVDSAPRAGHRALAQRASDDAPRFLSEVHALVLKLAAAYGMSALVAAAWVPITVTLGWSTAVVFGSGLAVGLGTMLLTMVVLDEAFRPAAARLRPGLERLAAAHRRAFRVVDVAGRRHQGQRDALLAAVRTLPLSEALA